MKSVVNIARAVAIVGSVLGAVACGGGGGSSSGGGTNTTPPATAAPVPTATVTAAPSPSTSPTPIPTLLPSPVPSTTPVSGQGFEVSGSISVAANILSDTDNNDPFSERIDNSSLANAQAIDNLGVINGFLTRDGTGNPADVFGLESDRNDFYRVALQAGQKIRLQVVDYRNVGPASLLGDLDMQLFDLAGNVVAQSDATGEFEEIVVADSGEYYLRIFPFSGSSKYVLDLASEFASATSENSFNTNVYLQDLVAGEAIVIEKAQATVSQRKSANSLAYGGDAMRTSLNQKREKLLRFTEKDVQASSSTNALGKPKLDSKVLSEFEQELAQLNPQAYRKINTIERIKTLQLSGDYELVSANFKRRLARAPNDISYPRQWHYPAINLPQAWDISTGQTDSDRDIIVAVVDTGIFLAHPELDGKLVDGFDFISDQDNALDGDGIDNNPDDPGDSSALGQSSWHGTHVAGTIAAESNNVSGVAGVSWEAKIMPLRVLGAEGGSSYDIIQAMRFAAGLENDSGTVPEQPADIINLSLGGAGSSTAENSFYQSLFDMGVIVVAAAGNENSSRNSFPAAYDGVFSVAAVDARGARAPYSNFGTTVDLAAPGGDLSRDRNGDGRGDGILSTSVDDASGAREASYSFQNGTSMAAPHVAGVFSLMKAVYPDLTANDVDRLLRTGKLNSNGSTERSDEVGYGIIDALAAVRAAQGLANGEDPPELPASMVAEPRGANIAGNASFDFTVSNRGGGAPSVTGIVSTQPWLSTSALEVDGNGLGTYRFSVNRDGLVDGTYLSQVTLNFDSANELKINVSMSVGEAVEAGKSSQLFVILVDELSDQSVDTMLAQSDSAGNLNYRFENVAAGDYTIYVGSDVDNDNFLCQYGEACGAYPTLNRISPRRVDSDISDLDLLVDIFSAISGANSSAADTGSDLRKGLEFSKPKASKALAPR